MTKHLTWFACAAACALAACGGGGSSPAPVHRDVATPTPAASASGTPNTTPSSTPSATAAPAIVQAFTITIPAAAPASSARSLHRAYVSTATSSIRIAVQSINGAPSSIPATIAALGNGRPGCTGTTSITCTVTAAAGVGNDVFAIATFASTSATGTPLATATVAANVTATPAAAIALSLDGVPASLAFSPTVLPLVNDGAIHRYAETIEALDAAGAAIVGASPFASNVALSISNDPTHALSLSTASVGTPGTIVTVTFDGSRGLADATIAASANGIATATLAAAPLQFSPASLFLYDDQSSGATTTVSQAGFTGTFAATLGDASDGHVSVTAGPPGTGSASVSVLPATTFDVTSLTVSNGIYAGSIPVTIVPRPGAFVAFGTPHTLGNPFGLVQTPDGRLWTADRASGSLVAFAPATGQYASYVVDSSDAGPTGVAVDGAGNLWFADGSQIGTFDPATATVKTYASGLYSNSRVLSIASGAAGSMWFYDERSNNVPAGTGNPTAFGTISTTTGAIAEYPTPDNSVPVLDYESMVTGPDGALWFADGAAGAIGRMTASGTYSIVAAAGPISPNFTTDVVTVGPDGNIWFAGINQGLAQGFAGTVDPATDAVALYSKGIESGQFDALTTGSSGDLFFAEQPGSGYFYSSQSAIGVINATTHASYAYAAIVPNDSVFGAALVDANTRTLYLLDTAFGRIGEVPFK